MASLLSTLTQPATFAINGAWGTGKTTAIRMLLPVLRADGHECVYFNAWENDFAGDPLIGLLAAVQEQAATKGSKSWQKAKKLGTVVARTVAPVAVKLLTYNALSLDQLKKIATDDTSDVVADFTQNVSEKLIDEHVQGRKTVSAFRAALAAFSTQIAQKLDGQTRSLILVVDELDRCRPTYAVETLERIKHLFNVPNVAFLLSLDLTQLGHSVRALYGDRIDAANYLRRFIDLTCDLPPASSLEFCKHLYSEFELAEVLAKEGDFVVELFSAVADAFNLSLRAQEQLFAEVAVAARLLHKRAFGAVELAVLLVVLRTVDDKLYGEYVTGVRGGRDVLEYLHQRPALARVVSGWPIIDVLLQGYSLVDGERLSAMQEVQTAASAAESPADVRNRAEWKLQLFQSAEIGIKSLATIIRPTLEFTASVRR